MNEQYNLNDVDNSGVKDTFFFSVDFQEKMKLWLINRWWHKLPIKISEICDFYLSWHLKETMLQNHNDEMNLRVILNNGSRLKITVLQTFITVISETTRITRRFADCYLSASSGDNLLHNKRNQVSIQWVTTTLVWNRKRHVSSVM